MKGLLIKDLHIMLQNKKFFIMLLFIAVLMLGLQGEEGMIFVISYSTMLCGMMVITTISIDEFDKSTVFLMTMPITRKGYVLEKYIFGIAVSTAGCLISTLICCIMMHGGQKDLIAIAFVLLGVFTLFEMVMLPIQFKYGGEKGRMALIIIVAAIVVGTVALKKLAEAVFTSQGEAEAFLSRLIDTVSSISGAALAAAAVVVWLAGTLLSYRISVGIMEKKEY